MPEFYMILARKMQEFYMLIAQKIFSRSFFFFFGGGEGGTCPPAPVSYAYIYSVAVYRVHVAILFRDAHPIILWTSLTFVLDVDDDRLLSIVRSISITASIRFCTLIIRDCDNKCKRVAVLQGRPKAPLGDAKCVTEIIGAQK